MKNKNQITKLLRRIFTVAMVTGLAACTADPVEMWGGKLPDQEALESTYGILRSTNAHGKEVNVFLTEGRGFVANNIYYQITKPTLVDLSLDTRVDATLLEAYNLANKKNVKLLPEANYKFPDGQTFKILKGEQRSNINMIQFVGDNLAAGEYLLPVTIIDTKQKNEWQTIYYHVKIRAPQMGTVELNTDQVFVVFYINTNIYQPLLVDDYYMIKQRLIDPTGDVWYRTIGNIINLRTVILDYNAATGRAMLNLGSDMRYVLNHVTKYIRPLQDKGRKVCLSLEGGGKGVGFCNLTDAQITDFVAQVKIVVEQYGLDGINLWDRNAGYGKVGTPAMNTTSYPKLIVALRAALGSDKLLTLTDHEKPTESFHDITATGGIEVGKYIDYAWSGYNDDNELVQIIDPYHQGIDNVSSSHPRKPIVGLEPSKYGCINIPWYSGTSQFQYWKHIFFWRQAGFKQSKILVYQDLRTVLQDNYEGTWTSSIGGGYDAFADDGITGSFELFPGFWIDSQDHSYTPALNDLGVFPNGNRGYGKWLKDW